MSPIRPQFKTYRERPFRLKDIEPIEFEGEDFLGGLVTDNAPHTLPPNALQRMLNGVYNKNQLFRRNGLQDYSLAKPDSNKILAIFTFFHNGTGINFLRFTSTSIYRAGSTGWTQITGAALNGTNNDPYSFTVADNRAFFSNGGADAIQEIDPSTASYSPLGNAPKYKYISSAFNRVIGANRRDAVDVPYEIGWSGDLDYDEWDPLVNISAGSTPLVNSPSDLSDGITGVFSLSSVLCVTRERSIWLATNLPSATNPFNFFVAVPRIGCDVPATTALAADGLIFYNFQNAAVYYYAPGEQPVEISQSVKRAIKNDVSNPNDLFGSYNYDTNIYSLFIVSNTSSTVKCYSYSFRSKVWSYDEFYNVSYVKDIDYSSSDLTIDELTGTIDDLEGTIDQLGGLVANANRFFGFGDGELNTQPLFAGFEGTINNIVLTDNGTEFETVFDSKTFEDKTEDLIVNYTQIVFTPYTTGTVTLKYSKDDGRTWNTYKSLTVTDSMLFKSRLMLARRLIRTRNFIWRFSTSDCMLTLDSYYVRADRAGLSTK